MVPDKDDSSVPQPVQARIVDREFYAARRSFVRNLPVWAKARGLGKEARLLELVAARSRPKDPFSWAVTGTQAEWAGQWGLSRTTLQRWISELRSAGYLTGEVRISPGLSGGRHRDVEYPVFGIPPEVVEEVSRWSEPGFWPTTCKPHFGAYSSDAQAVDETGENAQTAATAGLDVEDVTTVTPPPIIRSSSTSSKNIPAGRTSRLRRRGTSVRRLPDDDYDPPVIGADPDRVPARASGRAPVQQAADLFVDAWRDMIRSHPRVAMLVGTMPWPVDGKKMFMVWLKQQLLPAVDNDVERAGLIFVSFCNDLVSGSESIPGDMPAYKRLGRVLPKYTRSVRPKYSAEEIDRLADEREAAAERYRNAASRRRTTRQAPSVRVVEEHFLD